MMMNMGGSGGSMGSMGNMGSMGQNMQMPDMTQMPGMYTDPYAMHGSMQGHVTGGTNLLGGTDFTSLLSSLFNFALSVFIILLIIGLIVGTVVYVKRLLTGNGQLNSFFAPTPASVCTNCSQPVQAQWNVCPNCGQSKANA